jgi:hypothetical protein
MEISELRGGCRNFEIRTSFVFANLVTFGKINEVVLECLH